jgi:hypothetical protein
MKVRVQDDAVVDHLRDRGLVVIDPDDRDAVAQLAATIRLNGGWSYAAAAQDYRKHDEAVQAALREFVDPKPRIEEPRGLGAVVLDSRGAVWVQFDSVNGFWWRNHVGRNARWSDLDVARVLSHGYTGEEES